MMGLLIKKSVCIVVHIFLHGRHGHTNEQHPHCVEITFLHNSQSYTWSASIVDEKILSHYSK